MEKPSLERLTNRFASWNNLKNAVVVLDKEEVGGQYDCNWCNGGCGGCGGCGDNCYLPQNQEQQKGYLLEMKEVKVRASYECQGCSSCEGCNSCE